MPTRTAVTVYTVVVALLLALTREGMTMPKWWSRAFWLAAAERAVRTAAQTALATIGVDVVSIVDLDWTQVAGVSATAAVLSLLTSIAAGAVDPASGPSLGTEVPRGDE